VRPLGAGLVLCALLIGCGGADSPPSATEGQDGPSAGTGELTPDPDPEPAPPIDVPRGLAGRWWLLAPDLSYVAFRLDLEPAGLDGHFEGPWRSFDWRGTPREQAPYRISRPVTVQARQTGGELIIQGRAPQVDAEGRPNGATGSWTVTLRRNTTADGPSPWRGSLVHTPGAGAVRLTPAEGVPAELTHTFRMWEP